MECEEGIRKLLNREYTRKKLGDPSIRALMKKIKVVPDSDLDREYPNKWPTIVEIKTKRDSYSCRVDYPKGEPQNPLTREEILYKFKTLASNVLDKVHIKKVISTVDNIEEVQDIKKLVNLSRNNRR